jgi:hypothetical protein
MLPEAERNGSEEKEAAEISLIRQLVIRQIHRLL